MIFRRRKHKLPKFPPKLIPTFKALCEDLPTDEVRSYIPAIDHRLEEIVQDSQNNPRVDADLAGQIAERCKFLCEKYGDAEGSKRPLIVAAIRYFAVAEDAFSEEAFASGFRDDAMVINYVLEELSVEDQFIEL